MTMRRGTRRWLSDDVRLFDQVLARICGAWDADDPPERPPSPYEVCKQMGLSYGALLAWVTLEDERTERFDRALKLRAQLLAEETLAIADGEEGAVVARDKLRIQVRQFLASKWDRKRYGEHVSHEVSATLTIGDAAAELEALEKKLGLRAPITIDQPALPAPEMEDAQPIPEARPAVDL